MLETREREIKAKYTLLWRMNCEQLSEYDHIITVKEDEIVALKVHISFLERNQHSRPVTLPSRSVSFSSEIHSRPVALHETALTPIPGRRGISLLPDLDRACVTADALSERAVEQKRAPATLPHRHGVAHSLRKRLARERLVRE